MAEIGPFEIIAVETGDSGGHGPWGVVTLKRDGYEPCKLYVTPEEAEGLRSFKGPILLVAKLEKEQHRSADPYNWGMTCALQDDCENCHFASAGGPDKRTAMEAPKYVPEDQAKEFIRGYLAYCNEHYGEGWETMKWGWHPAIVIGEKGPTDEAKVGSTPEEAARVFGGDES